MKMRFNIHRSLSILLGLLPVLFLFCGVIMEPGPSPVQEDSPRSSSSSLNTASPPSPVQSASEPSSPERSVGRPSSPEQSVGSSPRRSPISSPAKSIPSSPYVNVSTNFSPLTRTPCTPQHEQKRPRLDVSSTPELNPTCSSTEAVSGQHCRDLFKTFPMDTSYHPPVFDDEQPLRSFCMTQEDHIITFPDQFVNEQAVEDEPIMNNSASSDESLNASASSDESLNASASSDEVLNTSASSVGSLNSSKSESVAGSVVSSAEEGDSSEEEQYSSDEECVPAISPKVHGICDITEDECVLNIMDLFSEKQLSKSQIGGVLKCVLKVIPKDSNIPKTQYSLFNFVKKLSPISKDKVIVHFYCSKCLAKLSEEEEKCSVPLCTGESHKFYQLPLADQIKYLFEHQGLADLIDKYSEERSNSNIGDNYCDLLDGSEFKRARIEGPYNLTFMGHSDGISVSDSSDASMWPVEWVVAEIHPRLRFKYTLISGIWVDECKPYLNSMLKPFVTELQRINEEGVSWIHPRTGQTHTSRVSVPSFCADAPVRAQLQNILLHGGKHCCHACEQKMLKLPAKPVQPGTKPKPRRRVYTFQEIPATLRTSDRMDRQGKEARRKKRPNSIKKVDVMGVRGLSVISDMPGCDRSTVVFPEYMHLLLCVVKDFMKMWFDKPGPWHLSEANRCKIDKFLKSVRIPDFLTRIPRSTEKYSSWKANELRSFVLFFSVIILSKCMKPKYFQHWLLFVGALNMLLQQQVSKDDVRRANLMLRLFCRDLSNLYSHKCYTYYMHNLTHLALLVERHGPLHANAAFMFESFNGKLAKYIHGTKNQGKELVNNIIIGLGVAMLRAKCVKQNIYGEGDRKVEFKNAIDRFTFPRSHLNLMFELGKFQEPIRAFYRCVINWEKYTCSLYKGQTKRNNYTICYLNSCGVREFGEIMYFCESREEKIAVVNKFRVDHIRTFCHEATRFVIKHIIPISLTDVVEVIDLRAILFKVVRVDEYVCLRPNTYEYNL